MFEGGWYKSGFFPNLLTTQTPTSLNFQLQEVGLIAVHTEVTDCLVVSIWRKPHLLQCDVYWTLIQRIIGFTGTDDFWRVLKQLKNFRETAKASRTVHGSWAIRHVWGPNCDEVPFFWKLVIFNAVHKTAGIDWIDTQKSDALLGGVYYSLWKLWGMKPGHHLGLRILHFVTVVSPCVSPGHHKKIIVFLYLCLASFWIFFCPWVLPCQVQERQLKFHLL